MPAWWALKRSRQQLREQARSGGRLGEILAVSGIVPAATLTEALARQHQHGHAAA